MRSIIAAILLFACSVYAEKVEIQILHTTDVHSHFVSEGEKEPGAYLKLASLIDMQRTAAGRENTLLIDTGDFLQGTLMASLSRGEAGAAVINAMEYDVFVPGNHEFDFGVPRFWELMEQLRPIVLCGNLHSLDSVSHPDFPTWRMFERGGARIAVIGATASFLNNWFAGDFKNEFRVDTAQNMLSQILKSVLEQHPDMIVLAIHQGTSPGMDLRNVNEVQAIARQYPEIDLILGGHTHFEFSGRKLGERTWYVQPGHHGECFGIITATIDTNEHKVEEIQSFLRFNEDEFLQEYMPAAVSIAQWRQQADDLSEQSVVNALSYPISAGGTPGQNCEASEMICAAMAEYFQAPLALHGTLSDKSLPSGVPITQRDLFELLPYDNEVIEIMVTKEELAKIVAEQWLNRKQSGYCGIYGAMVKVNKNSEEYGVQVLGLGEKRKPMEEGRRYKMVLNNHTAAGSGRFVFLRSVIDSPDSQMKSTGISIRQVVEAYLKKHADKKIVPVKWIK